MTPPDPAPKPGDRVRVTGHTAAIRHVSDEAMPVGTVCIVGEDGRAFDPKTGRTWAIDHPSAAHTFVPVAAPATPPADPETGVLPCPFCQSPPTWNSHRTYAICRTPECYGGKMPIIPADDAQTIAAWNRRSAPATHLALASRAGEATDDMLCEGELALIRAGWPQASARAADECWDAMRRAAPASRAGEREPNSRPLTDVERLLFAMGERAGRKQVARWHEERAARCERINQLHRAAQHRDDAAAIRALASAPAQPVAVGDEDAQHDTQERPTDA